jgi:V8-like Glu-specific endopeptidase
MPLQEVLVKGKRKLTPRVWAGLLATPVLAIAVVFALGVAGATAGPGGLSAPAATAADMTVVHNPTRQTVAEVAAYWTEARMEQAQPYPMPTRSGAPSTAEGTLTPMAEPTGAPGAVAGALPGGAPLGTAVPETSTEPQHTPYHDFIPYTRWSLIGRYDKYPNWTILKMFFSQDHDGNGTLSNFVCSASTMGPDEAWTAGHCVTNNLSGAGANAGFSTNVLVCPVYDNGVHAANGCWGSDTVVTLTAYRNGGNGNLDFGAIDTSNTGTVVNNLLGNHTGWLGFAWNQSRNQHWVGMGYPAGAPFAGGKIIMAASGYGYDDDWPPDAVLGVAMGSNLTGGSSGGPWIISYGLPGQVAGGGNNFINGHNDWKWNTEPEAMVSPYFDCRPMAIYNFLRGTAHCP